MRAIATAVLFAVVCSPVVALAQELGATCAYGLSEFGVEVKTNCAISWNNPVTGKTYCFSKEEAKTAFLKDADANIKKAEAKYAELHRK